MRVVALMSGAQGERAHNAYKEGEGSHRRILLIIVMFVVSMTSCTLQLFSGVCCVVQHKGVPEQESHPHPRGTSSAHLREAIEMHIHILEFRPSSIFTYNTVYSRVVLCCRVEVVENCQGHFLCFFFQWRRSLSIGRLERRFLRIYFIIWNHFKLLLPTRAQSPSQTLLFQRAVAVVVSVLHLEGYILSVGINHSLGGYIGGAPQISISVSATSFHLFSCSDS